jgi:hypothetical protein
MAHAAADRLSPGERRALASFLSGRLPAGQLHAELCRARAAAETVREPAPVAPAPALRAA